MGWENVRYHRIDAAGPAIQRFLDCIGRTHVNGGAILACLAADDPKAFDQSVRLDVGDSEDPCHAFMRSPSVINALPELNIDESKLNLLELTPTTLAQMQGALTQILVDGGAYKKFDGSINEAKTIVRNFIAALVEARFGETRVAVSHEAWTDWFCGVAWDETYIVYDVAWGSFWLLCITDTD